VADDEAQAQPRVVDGFLPARIFKRNSSRSESAISADLSARSIAGHSRAVSPVVSKDDVTLLGRLRLNMRQEIPIELERSDSNPARVE